jgi:hypothetical protein
MRRRKICPPMFEALCAAQERQRRRWVAERGIGCGPQPTRRRAQPAEVVRFANWRPVLNAERCGVFAL